ncbi:hypothetical protein HFO32_22215 [Rhizobium leguminosarum]|uniref:hypothetical protein n=1 Tax=Rhizobiaceae TaxID=82115 RepID=UPI000FDB2D1A|nr:MULTISPECIES: hypothetical protein [Rhizobiaceae]MBY5684841.1 hypothetical protein [Rhizobium leguminosarum]RVL87659.1 hypothetical protein CN140_01640 [Sinorhizobium meliloti]
MTIDAKIVDAKKQVRTVSFHDDDPSDIELIKALGGKEGDDFEYLGEVDQWSVIRLKGGSDRMVVGKPPQNSAPVKRRQSCVLADGQAASVAYFFP